MQNPGTSEVRSSACQWPMEAVPSYLDASLGRSFHATVRGLPRAGGEAKSQVRPGRDGAGKHAGTLASPILSGTQESTQLAHGPRSSRASSGTRKRSLLLLQVPQDAQVG